MSNFRDCIVSFIDLNNISDILTRRSAKGVRLMRDLHELVSERVVQLTAHEEVCFWQDSVLLLAFVDSTKASFRKAMHDVTSLKNAIDALHPCHAICVKGQSFPIPNIHCHRSRPRAIYLSASSLAFSNCFEIEGKLKKRQADWYIDSRIAAKIVTRSPDYTDQITLLPARNPPRDILVFRGSFV